MIQIQPIELGLNLGTATQLKLTVNYELGSSEVTLQGYLFNDVGVQLNVSPINLDVPVETLQGWALDFSPVIAWALSQLGCAEAI
jgi:hypothetical protein